MNVLTPTLGLGVGYSERYAQQSKCSNVRTKTLRGALPGGDARHMLLQDSLLGALAVQVIWGLCWAASRTLGTLDQR